MRLSFNKHPAVLDQSKLKLTRYVLRISAYWFQFKIESLTARLENSNERQRAEKSKNVNKLLRDLRNCTLLVNIRLKTKQFSHPCEAFHSDSNNKTAKFSQSTISLALLRTLASARRATQSGSKLLTSRLPSRSCFQVRG